MKSKWMVHRELELIPRPWLSLNSLMSWLSFLLSALGKHSIDDQQLHVWTTTTSTGQLHWHIYDRMSQKKACLDSEVEARIWVEQRYYC